MKERLTDEQIFKRELRLCREAFVGVEKGEPARFIHHLGPEAEILEYEPEDRIQCFRTTKMEDESLLKVARRLHEFRPIPKFGSKEETSLDKAGEACDKAREAYDKAWEAYVKKHGKQIISLVPDTTWDGESIFGKGWEVFE